MLNNIITITLLLVVACASAYALTSVEMLAHNQIITAGVFILSKIAISYKFIKS